MTVDGTRKPAFTTWQRTLRNFVSTRVRQRSTGRYRLTWRNPAGGPALRSRAAFVRVVRRRRR